VVDLQPPAQGVEPVIEPVRGRALAGVSGVVYVVLSIFMVVTIQGEPLPTTGTSPQQVADFYARHRLGFLIGNYLGVLALAPSVPFMAYLTQVVRRREGEAGTAGLTFFGLGLLAHALGGTCLAMFQTLPLVESPALAKVVSDLANLAFGLCFVLIAAFAASAAWAVLSTDALPRWAGWTVAALCPAALVASLGTIVTTGPLAAGGPVMLAVFMAYLAWTLAVSVALLRADQRSANHSAA
jgi:hypothetical protein